MDYTLQQALDALNALNSSGDTLKADLIDLVKRVSVQAQGVDADATTVLYSGKIRDTRASDIIDSMKADASIRTVDKTVAAKLPCNAPVSQH